jgi:hypothetical protein
MPSALNAMGTSLSKSGLASIQKTARRFKWAMAACYAASVALVSLGLWFWGAIEVRGHLGEVLPLTLLGLVWLGLARALFPWLGLSIAHDVIERRNPAALVASAAATVAIAIIYAGGSLGEGPSYWNNFFSAGLATIGFFLAWVAIEVGGGISRSVCEERDLASGIRFSGLALAIGLILARSVAGDWHSEWATVEDFIRDAWGVAVLVAIAVFLERTLRPNRKRPVPDWRTFGVLPALVYGFGAWAWVIHLGRWEGMPQ